jgi:CDP-diacylglycerol---serine O-phosphatidyltransferase
MERKMKRNHGRLFLNILPSLFTLGNLLCGFLALTNVVKGTNVAYVTAAWWIVIAAIFDALDGKVARLAGSSSEFGIEFDSLADLVSFGVAPAVLIHNYILADAGPLGYILSFGFLATGAIRLARYNVSAVEGRKSYFTGMPIPSAASILAALVLFAENVWGRMGTLDVTTAIIIFTAIAMVSTFHYSAFPRISFSTPRETTKSTSFLLTILLMILFPDEMFFPVGIVYLLSGPAVYLFAPAVENVSHRGTSA